MGFKLTCMICGDTEDKIMPEYPGKSNLVALQEHGMELHKITQENLAGVQRVSNVVWYNLPDGRP